MSIQGSWMIVLTSLEVYNSNFNIPEQNNTVKLCKFPDSKSGVVSYEKVRDENEKKNLEITEIRATELKNGIIGPIIIKECREQLTKRMKTDKFMNFFSFLCYVYLSRF